MREYDEACRKSNSSCPTFDFSTTMMATVTHGVAPSLSPALAPIRLAEVATAVNKIWLGRVLYLRVVRPATRKVGVTVLVEDSRGDVVRLCLYNIVEDGDDPRAAFPLSSKLALLEPYMRHARDDPVRGMLLLRCDNPQHVVRFEDAPPGSWSDPDTWIASASSPPIEICASLVDRGNGAFKAGKL